VSSTVRCTVVGAATTPATTVIVRVMVGGVIRAATLTHFNRTIIGTARLTDMTGRIVATTALADVSCGIIRTATSQSRGCNKRRNRRCQKGEFQNGFHD
jgi:hypothetical protein